jgi:hypothetical protein
LKNGFVQTCGCSTEHHGHCKGYKVSPEYSTWQRMKTVCYNPKNPNYEYAGGRGWVVMWESFAQFFADLGPRPPGHWLMLIPLSLTRMLGRPLIKWILNIFRLPRLSSDYSNLALAVDGHALDLHTGRNNTLHQLW